jgi:hypothetical protein
MSGAWEIFKAMMKEEWRVHSSMFGGRNFALFPAVLFAMAFIGTLFIPMFRQILPTESIATVAHYMMLLFGLSIGAFGLLARESMNRRFGQASLIAYSSRTLPVSEQAIFADFFAKDVIYYHLLWIFPLMLGLALASPLAGILPGRVAVLAVTIPLSFLIGLSISFVLSTVYVHSLRALAAIVILLAALLIAANNILPLGLVASLPPLAYFFSPTPDKLLISAAFVLASSSLSILFLKVDFNEKKRHFRNALDAAVKGLWFARTPYNLFVAKDFLDMQRSEGGIGRIIFSYLFPLAIVWLLLSVFLRILPFANPLIVFSIFLSIISSSIYNWLTEFDVFTTYSFMPVKVSTVIKSKMLSYALMNCVAVFILIVVAFGGGVGGMGSGSFLPALVGFVSISAYVLAVNVYLAGLYPNVLLYNAKLFLAYVALISPMLVVMIFASAFEPNLMLASPILALPAWALLKSGLSKWDGFDQPSY